MPDRSREERLAARRADREFRGLLGRSSMGRSFKSSTSCRLCGHWIEGDWNTAPKGPEGDDQRAKAQREMSQGACDSCIANV